MCVCVCVCACVRACVRVCMLPVCVGGDVNECWCACVLHALVNPRRACAARVTVVVLCVCLSVCLYVCMYVCLSEHAILAVCAVRSITKDAIVLSVRFAAILKRRFS